MFHIGFKLFIRQYTAEIDFNDGYKPVNKSKQPFLQSKRFDR